MPIPDAEKLKRKCGCALSAMVDEDETMDVASVGGRRSRVMARRILSEILQPRAEEIFHLVWDEIRRAGYEKSLNSGIVLTGGGAILEGMPEIAEQIFDLPIRRGAPAGIGGLADHVSSPAFATPVGLVVYGQRNQVVEARHGGRRRVQPRGGPPEGPVSRVLLNGQGGYGMSLRTACDANLQGHRSSGPSASARRGPTRGRPDQGRGRGRGRQQCRLAHGAARASRASSSSSPTRTCRRCRTTRRR